MRTLPSGVLTYVFSDVEGSTRLARLLGDQVWADCLELHRALLSRAIMAHGGIVIDLEGDGTFAVFQRPTDAIAGAVAGQVALAQQAFPGGQALLVRMGIHTGQAILRGEHYVGHEVHRAS